MALLDLLITSTTERVTDALIVLVNSLASGTCSDTRGYAQLESKDGGGSIEERENSKFPRHSGIGGVMGFWTDWKMGVVDSMGEKGRIIYVDTRRGLVWLCD
jgi:hypothetical protein